MDRELIEQVDEMAERYGEQVGALVVANTTLVTSLHAANSIDGRAIARSYRMDAVSLKGNVSSSRANGELAAQLLEEMAAKIDSRIDHLETEGYAGLRPVDS